MNQTPRPVSDPTNTKHIFNMCGNGVWPFNRFSGQTTNVSDAVIVAAEKNKFAALAKFTKRNDDFWRRALQMQLNVLQCHYQAMGAYWGFIVPLSTPSSKQHMG